MYRSLLGKVLILAIIVHVVVTQIEDGPSIESDTESRIEAESILNPTVEPTVNAEPALEVIPKTSNEAVEAPKDVEAVEAVEVAPEAIEAGLSIPEASAVINEATPSGPVNSAAAVENSFEGIKARPETIPDSSSAPGSEHVSG